MPYLLRCENKEYNMARILISEPIPPALLNGLRAHLPPDLEVGMVPTKDDADFVQHAADAEVLILGVRSLPQHLLKQMPRLRFIQRGGVGYDNIDIEAVAQAGVLAAYTPGANAGTVAEHTLMLMLALLKRLSTADAASRANRWAFGEIAQAGIGDLSGATVGLIGLGAIGSAVAERLQPFGARVLYTARKRRDDQTEQALAVRYVSLEELLATSTIVSLHVPVTDETRGLLDQRTLAMMRPGALLINTSRGELIDEAALRRAIESGHLGGAGLDVLLNERDGGNPFADLPQVLVTPHVAGTGRAGIGNLLRMAGENVTRYLRGEQPINLVPGLG
jgi:phosphoglycerate dehydrogenase-like enzyme